MKFLKSLFIIGFSFASCQNSDSSKKSAISKDSTSEKFDSIIYPSNLQADSFPNGEIINERGLLKEIEDSGYPFYNLVIEFPERKFEESFNLNMEEIKDLNSGKLMTLKNKYINFSYTSEVKNSLLDIQVKGNSIFDTDVVALNEETNKVTGILGGAEEITLGDLPGNVTITNKKGEVFEFNFYITESMVFQNGKTVTAFFEERTINEIKSLSKIKN